MSSETERLKRAASHFANFFGELNQHFAERGELLQQIALALLAREHVLISGPPGTAKSRIASAVLRRIVDESSKQPSVYARQFTESTVQTDLIGPIDFKTLTETGRTEHFTDEGMLGAVHAFLDEVFDGRDMLLRSTLNVLHERELKQGTRTTLGQIECALMTTNRYLSEVLEHSRETLLAFIDRIAFVSFVPKGFAEPDSLEAVLRTQLAGRASALTALLTIQDVDALQRAVDAVRIPSALCQSLVLLVRDFESEIAAAVRADPTFVPTRYLSTRSIVRLGKLLKALCVFDRAFYDPDRPPVAAFKDLAGLRLGLVLGGCSSEAAQKLLGSETDPRERRQLALLRTEREIFERCLSRLEEPDPLSVAAATVEAIAPVAVEQQASGALLDRARTLSTVADSAAPDAGRAEEQLKHAVDELTQRAFTSGVTTLLGTHETPVQIVEGLAALADELEQTSADRRTTARWLRGRALDALHGTARLVPTDLGAQLEAAGEAGVSIEDAEQRADTILLRISSLASLRDRLRAGGALETDADAGNAAWRAAVERSVDCIVTVWDAAFHGVVEDTLHRVSATELAGIIEGLGAPIRRMDALDELVHTLHPELGRVKARVVGPRIGPFVEAAFRRFGARQRLAVAQQVEGVLDTLSGSGLLTTIAPGDLLAWTAEALLRSDATREGENLALGEQGYRNLRFLEERVTCVYVLVDVCLRLLPSLAQASEQPNAGLTRVRETLGALPENLLQRISERDLDRVERPVAFLERWWQSLEAECAPLEPAPALERLVKSRFFRITMGEQALARFELELELLRNATGLASERADRLSWRIAALSANSSQLALDKLEAKNGALWRRTLPASPGA